MPRIYEKSSGGVVYRIREGEVQILLLRWLNSKKREEFVIPKGHIEEGEIARETAIREIAEETGLKEKDFEVIKFITKLNYTFTAGHLEDNPLIDKDVYLFLVKYNGDEIPFVQEEERFIGYKWATFDEIEKIDVKFDLKGIVKRNKTYFI